MFFGTLKAARMLQFVFLSLTVLFALLAIGHLVDNVKIPHRPRYIPRKCAFGASARPIFGIRRIATSVTFGLTAFTSYGSFWLTLVAILLMPKMGLADAPNAQEHELQHTCGFQRAEEHEQRKNTPQAEIHTEEVRVSRCWRLGIW
jgi:succinate-acetate transporter protein